MEKITVYHDNKKFAFKVSPENLIAVLMDNGCATKVSANFDKLLKWCVDSYSSDVEFMTIESSDYHSYGKHLNQMVVGQRYYIFENLYYYDEYIMAKKLKNKLKPKTKLVAFDYDGKVRVVITNKEDNKNIFGKELTDGCASKCFTKTKMSNYMEREIDTDNINVQL